jgi:hypothetical protein
MMHARLGLGLAILLMAATSYAEEAKIATVTYNVKGMT